MSRAKWAPRRRLLVPAFIGFVVAAIIGGVVGGLIVREWDSDDGSPAPVSSGAPACSAAKVADDALRSVVTVRASSSQEGGSGSGVVLRPGGYILTNNHVISVAAGGGTVSILRADGESSDASIVGRDPLTDLAVIKAKDPSNLPPVALGKSDALAVGEPVVALGSPLGLTSTVTAGIVSALNRYVRVPSDNGGSAHLVGAIQTDASINPGNSGGALLDCGARLVGINTAGATVPESGGGSIGLGFAIPVDLAKGIADELIANGKVTRPSFGLQVQPISEELAQAVGASPGLFVQAVTAGGAADKAGLRPGDVIVEIDGDPARSADDLIVKTLELKAGDVVRLTYHRLGATHTASLTLTSG
ncbi:MAG TPA: trypsin-like peptidase domain-containing protein [Gaiellaceae bacterium]|jgi:putative serine protease PepD|nr:trypsin-like peptidase domain-containing protein [Gaiellaceae bacterium]